MVEFRRIPYISCLPTGRNTAGIQLYVSVGEIPNGIAWRNCLIFLTIRRETWGSVGYTKPHLPAAIGESAAIPVIPRNARFWRTPSAWKDDGCAEMGSSRIGNAAPFGELIRALSLKLNLLHTEERAESAQDRANRFTRQPKAHRIAPQ